MKFEIVDEKAAYKSGLMKLVPDEEKINEILKDKRDKKQECTESGIRYFYEIKF